MCIHLNFVGGIYGAAFIFEGAEMENCERLALALLAGMKLVTAGALRASHPKPGLTATC